MASFAVVTMVREEPEVIRQFLDYWTAVGAEKIYLFFDGDIPLDSFSEYDAVELRLVDEALWQEIGIERPDSLARCQHHVFNHIYPSITTDWLIFPDCDEMIAGTVSVTDFLDSVPERVVSVGLPVAEAVFGPGDDMDIAYGATFFRVVPAGRRRFRLLVALLYGRDRKYLASGVAGHTRGKQFVRTGRTDIMVGNHSVQRSRKRVTQMAPAVPELAGGMWLFHFDAMCFSAWEGKWKSRIANGPPDHQSRQVRKDQFAFFKDVLEAGQERRRAVFRRFYGFTAWQWALARRMGAAFRMQLFAADGPMAHRGRFPGESVSHLKARESGV